MFRRKPKPQIDIEWLIVGLGNPGSEYSGTRHNVGFEAVERFAKAYGIKFDQSKHRARFGVGLAKGLGVAVAKPMTYMNLSGQAVKPMLEHFRLGPDRLIVVADETDLPLGKLRIRAEGGAGGHNGHKSIIGTLGTTVYTRLRIGIGRVSKDETIDHVLGRFDVDERQEAHETIDLAVDALEAILEEGVERAMNRVNA